MIKCPDCKKNISEKAVSCPKCGCPISPDVVKKDKAEQILVERISWWIVGIVIVCFIFLGNSEKEFIAPVVKKTAEELRAEKVKKSFSGQGGSNINLIRLVEESMHAPSSFKHVKTEYIDAGDYLIVRMQFRAKNAFGALVLDEVSAQTTLEGEVVRIIGGD